MRRLVEIETEDFAVLAPGASGPLGDHVTYIWVDQPTISKIVVEVRLGDHPVERRELAVRGLAGDVAARIVALAIAEMVRVTIAWRPPPPPPPAAPPRPSPEAIARAARLAPAVSLSPLASFVGLPGASGALGGAGAAIGFRYFGATETLSGRWLTGKAGGSDLRWLEIALGADYRFWLSPSFRLALGGSAAFASAHVAGARAVAGEVGQRESWSARAGGAIALEARLTPSIWIALDIEPGAVLRPVRFTGTSGAAGVVQGAWLGAGLSVRFERVRAPSPAQGL